MVKVFSLNLERSCGTLERHPPSASRRAPRRSRQHCTPNIRRTQSPPQRSLKRQAVGVVVRRLKYYIYPPLYLYIYTLQVCHCNQLLHLFIV